MRLAQVIIPIYNEEKILKNNVKILSNFFDKLIGKKNGISSLLIMEVQILLGK